LIWNFCALASQRGAHRRGLNIEIHPTHPTHSFGAGKPGYMRVSNTLKSCNNSNLAQQDFSIQKILLQDIWKLFQCKQKIKRPFSFLRSTFITVLQCMSYILMIIVLLELLQLRLRLLDRDSFPRKPHLWTIALTWLLGMEKERFAEVTRARCTSCRPPARRRRSSWDLSSSPPPSPTYPLLSRSQVRQQISLR